MCSSSSPVRTRMTSPEGSRAVAGVTSKPSKADSHGNLAPRRPRLAAASPAAGAGGADIRAWLARPEDAWRPGREERRRRCPRRRALGTRRRTGRGRRLPPRRGRPPTPSRGRARNGSTAGARRPRRSRRPPRSTGRPTSHAAPRAAPRSRPARHRRGAARASSASWSWRRGARRRHVVVDHETAR